MRPFLYIVDVFLWSGWMVLLMEYPGFLRHFAQCPGNPTVLGSVNRGVFYFLAEGTEREVLIFCYGLFLLINVDASR